MELSAAELSQKYNGGETHIVLVTVLLADRVVVDLERSPLDSVWSQEGGKREIDVLDESFVIPRE